jgi:hypothetical protein
VFVPGKPFQPSLMFAGKAGTYPSVAPNHNEVLQASVFATASYLRSDLIFTVKATLRGKTVRGFTRVGSVLLVEMSGSDKHTWQQYTEVFITTSTNKLVEADAVNVINLFLSGKIKFW